jgi:hypothetical protein
MPAPHGSASAPLPWLPEDLMLPEPDLERATRFTVAEAFRSDGPTSSPSISRTVRLPPSLLSILRLQVLPGGPGGAGHLRQAVQAGQACARGRVVLGLSVRRFPTQLTATAPGTASDHRDETPAGAAAGRAVWLAMADRPARRVATARSRVNAPQRPQFGEGRLRPPSSKITDELQNYLDSAARPG